MLDAIVAQRTGGGRAATDGEGDGCGSYGRRAAQPYVH